MPDRLDKHELARLREITRFTTDALPERTSQLHQEDARRTSGRCQRRGVC